MKRSPCSLLLVLLSLGTLVRAGEPPRAHLGAPLARIAARAAALGVGAGVLRQLRVLDRVGQVDFGHPIPRVLVRARYDRGDLGPVRAAGAEVRGRMGDVVSLMVPVTALEGLARVPGVLSIRPARRYRLKLDVSVPETGGSAVFGDYALSGKGVLVGVVDTGIDWKHGDFRNPDGTTRIAGIWDQTDSSGFPPSGFSFGTYYSRAVIDNALQTSGSLATGDGHGHGTHVAGIAGGSGLDDGDGSGAPAGTYRGLAPEADILVVRVFDDFGNWTTNSDLVAALDFVDLEATALGKPAVVNMSLGDQYGPHDGTTPDEVAIGVFNGFGRAVVVAAGNERDTGLHTEGTLTTGLTLLRTIEIPAYTANGGSGNDLMLLNMWHDPLDTIEITLKSPGDLFTLVHTSGDGLQDFSTVDGYMSIEDGIDPILGNGDREVEIEVWDQFGSPPRAGVWTLEIKGVLIQGSGHFDIWNYFTWVGGNCCFREVAPSFNNELVGSPANANLAIAVGAHVSRTCWPSQFSPNTCYGGGIAVGDLAWFSSPGPRRNNTRKPDITAPGAAIVSSRSTESSPPSSVTTPGGAHRTWQGTSMSTPHAAGGVALMFEANPNLAGGQARFFLRTNARLDGGAVEGIDWGWGKMDLAAAIGDMLNLFTDVMPASPTAASFTWTGPADAVSFNVYRGLISSLDGGNYGSCVVSGLTTPEYTDTDPDPAVGDGYFYLFTAKESITEGNPGQKSDGSLRPNLSPGP